MAVRAPTLSPLREISHHAEHRKRAIYPILLTDFNLAFSQVLHCMELVNDKTF